MNRLVLFSSLFILLICLNLVQVAAGATISWQDWDISTFDKAVSENKLILINVGMEGCGACASMSTITYADADVIEKIEQHFVAIAVDAEARPDIGERYSDWAWPATIFLKPDSTQVLALRGNRMPRNFIPILDDLITKHKAGTLEPDPDSPYAAPPRPVATELTRIRDQVRLQLDRSLNEENGGWSRRGVRNETSGARLKHLYIRAHMYGNKELETLALKTADVIIRGIDPVWGGAYGMTFHNSGKNSEGFRRLGGMPEMRISAQANTIAAAAQAYQLTGDEKYLTAALEVDRYLRNWMLAPDGTFYTNQKISPSRLPENLSGFEYWMIDTDAGRRQYGIPPVDHAIYTDKNSEVIIAYVSAYEAFGNYEFLATAIRAANTLIDRRIQKAGWLLQTEEIDLVVNDKRAHPYETLPRPFLSAQAWFGSAMLSLYRATGDELWLNHARRTGEALIEILEDKDNGGFYATTPDNTASIIPPRKPLEQNGVAANYFYELWVYSKDDRFKDIPERTLRAVALPDILKREGRVIGQLAMALEKVTTAYVEFSIVGDPDDKRSRALYDAGRDIYHPRKIQHYEQPGRYPDRGKPAMYICNPDKCSLPIEDPADVAGQAQSFASPAASG